MSEKIIKDVTVHGKDCVGCKRHDRDVMIAYRTDEKNDDEFDEIHDMFLTHEQAETLFKRLGTVLGVNKVKVEPMEYEAGWGSRLDEVKEFDSYEEAEKFCTEFNARNNEPTTPSWYMTATIVGER